MTFVPQHLVYVYYHGFDTKQLMGRLLLKNRKIFFEYDTAFIKLGLALSPLKLPLKVGVIPSTNRTFEQNAPCNLAPLGASRRSRAVWCF
jgi:hypothetical protein